MRKIQIAVIGAGPAGLSAALAAADAGAKVTILDENPRLGGQLVKQTHPFFGAEEQQAGTRGIDIARRMAAAIGKQSDRIEVLANSTVTGIFSDVKTITYLDGNRGGSFGKMRAERMIVATGASENMLAFPNNDLPGVYGAGAVQTLVNVYGVKIGERVLMVGSGNVGLIVSYQLEQAGIKVVAVVEAAPKIGGYQVHADKLKRLGVPIYTWHTVKEVLGKDCVEGATIVKLDDKWNPKAGSEKTLEVDTVCLAVGLTPLADLLWQAGCRMTYAPELGGYVPVRDEDAKTSIDWIYVAGDASGIEEASTALVGGKLAGICAAESLGFAVKPGMKEELRHQLDLLRSGPFGEMKKKGKGKGVDKGGASMKAVIECTQDIPCDPCVKSCPVGAISKKSLSAAPRLDENKCTGCANCVPKCPGRAIFAVSDGRVVLPYEFLPAPKKDQPAELLDRGGKKVGTGKILAAREFDRTFAVTVSVPIGFEKDVRNIRIK